MAKLSDKMFTGLERAFIRLHVVPDLSRLTVAANTIRALEDRGLIEREVRWFEGSRGEIVSAMAWVVTPEGMAVLAHSDSQHAIAAEQKILLNAAEMMARASQAESEENWPLNNQELAADLIGGATAMRQEAHRLADLVNGTIIEQGPNTVIGNLRQETQQSAERRHLAPPKPAVSADPAHYRCPHGAERVYRSPNTTVGIYYSDGCWTTVSHCGPRVYWCGPNEAFMPRGVSITSGEYRASWEEALAMDEKWDSVSRKPTCAHRIIPMSAHKKLTRHWLADGHLSEMETVFLLEALFDALNHIEQCLNPGAPTAEPGLGCRFRAMASRRPCFLPENHEGPHDLRGAADTDEEVCFSCGQAGPLNPNNLCATCDNERHLGRTPW